LAFIGSGGVYSVLKFKPLKLALVGSVGLAVCLGSMAGLVGIV